ncbi:MAG: hypothetical protein ABIR18_10355 [Chitinophagaceae bacterium]
MQVLGIVFFFIGVIIIFIIRRRKFNRRMITAAEQSKSYDKDALITQGEKLGRIVGILLIMTGIFFFVVGWGDQKLEERNRNTMPESKEQTPAKS